MTSEVPEERSGANGEHEAAAKAADAAIRQALVESRRQILKFL